MLSILVHDFKDPSIRNDIYDKQVQPNVKDMLFQIQSVAPFYAHLARLRRKSSLFIPSLKKKKKKTSLTILGTKFTITAEHLEDLINCINGNYNACASL